MAEEIEPSEAVEPWDMTLEALLYRIQQEKCPIQMHMYGYGIGQGMWWVECGYERGYSQHINLLDAVVIAYSEWQAKRPKYEKRQAKRAAKIKAEAKAAKNER